MATQEKTWNVANRLHSLKDSDNPEVNHIIAGADEIYDDAKGEKQSNINAQADAALADRYTKAETYSKEQLDSMITTPDVNYITVATFADLPQTGEADTVYRVSSYDGTQVDASKYALYAWNGTSYQLLAVRSAVGEVFDVSEYNSGSTYETLAAALAAVPAGVQRGGMSIKFIQLTPATYSVVKTEGLTEQPTGTEVQEALSIDTGSYTAEQLSGITLPSAVGNNVTYWVAVTVDEVTTYTTWVITYASAESQEYVQYRLMSTAWSTVVADWQGIDSEPVAGSSNLVESGGVADTYGEYINNSEFMCALTDQGGKFLYGIKEDGDVKFGCKIPSDIQAALNDKVSAEQGKGLSTNDYDNVQKEIVNTGRIEQYSSLLMAITDNDNKILSRINSDGSFTFNTDVEFNGAVGFAKDFNTKYVAASDAPDRDKKIADYVCDGVNDEKEITAALYSFKGKGGRVKLSSGTFHIDAFSSSNRAGKCAICPPPEDTYMDYYIEGCGHRHGTLLQISESAFDNISSSEQPCVISSYNRTNFNGLYVSKMRIDLPYIDRKCICINMQYAGHGNCEFITMAAIDGNNSNTPVEGLVGFRGYNGYSTGTIQLLRHMYATGFYEAFQIGGEHIVGWNLGSRYNYYGFTFGNYEYTWGTFDHPIVLFNCADEGSVNLPLFAHCGWHNDEEGEGHVISDEPRQAILLIGWNIEASRVENRAHENTPNSFCGRISYTSGGVGKNSRTALFWDSTSGKCFETTNLTHAKGGTTAERNTYSPNYLQEYYDIDLGKKLIYDGANWVEI